jgi:hypothetical protein
MTTVGAGVFRTYPNRAALSVPVKAFENGMSRFQA